MFITKILPLIFLLVFVTLLRPIRRTHVHELNVNESTILINQQGFRPTDKKTAFVKNSDPGNFQIISAKSNDAVFQSAAIYSGSTDLATGDKIYVLDFSSVTKPGEYFIQLSSNPESRQKFNIGFDVYDKCTAAALESFYYQRCGTKIDNGTIWKHPACHMEPAVFFTSEADNSLNKITRDETGGWHDAGDYNKFIPTTTESAALLLYAYESNPDFFNKEKSNIPENTNSLPDILDEVKWGLDWIMKMQRNDGAVFHKVSIEKWTGEHLPDKETDTQYIFNISSSSTASTAAVTALAARIFNDFDKDYALRLLRSSLAAWNFLSNHPENIPEGGFKNPFGVEGGEYTDPNDLDGRIWAAVELYKISGDKNFLDYFLSNYKKVGGPNYTIGFDKTANFAYYSFLKIPAASSNETARNQILATLVNYSNHLLMQIKDSKYNCVLAPDQYYWGSNSVLLGFAFDLINAYNFTSDRRYIEGALEQLNYLLGRNPFGISFVTGLGYNSVKYPYHQFSMLLKVGKPVPGLVVGGPNKFSRINGKIISQFPGLCYEDTDKNYYVNEPAINYTAPLVYVAGYFSQIEAKTNNEQISNTK